jgi:release factor glutamine methyltransferase
MTAGGISAGGMTVGGMVDLIADRLAGAGVVSAAPEAAWLAEEALGLDSGRLTAARREPIPADARKRLEALAGRRAAGEPLQYVIGWAPFGPLRLAVGPGVLVPRPETEALAERAAAHLRVAARSAGPDGRAIAAVAGDLFTGPDGRAIAVDLCTGAAPIACYLARAVPAARVLATELDPAALAWARRNAVAVGGPRPGGRARAGGGSRIEVLAGDLDEPLPATIAGRVAVLTANVPYVPSDRIATLPADVRDHEPRLALDGGPDGLDVLRRVVRGAGRWLGPGGWILCEIGDDQGPAATALAERAGFDVVAVRPDLAGRDRILEGQWRPANTPVATTLV